MVFIMIKSLLIGIYLFFLICMLALFQLMIETFLSDMFVSYQITKQYFSRLSVSLIIQLYEIQSVKAAEFKWKLNEPNFSVELPSDEFSS